MNCSIPKFIFKTISEQKLDKVQFNSFQNKMSSGVDKISMVLVKKIKDEINKPLVYV